MLENLLGSVGIRCRFWAIHCMCSVHKVTLTFVSFITRDFGSVENDTCSSASVIGLGTGIRHTRFRESRIHMKCLTLIRTSNPMIIPTRSVLRYFPIKLIMIRYPFDFVSRVRGYPSTIHVCQIPGWFEIWKGKVRHWQNVMRVEGRCGLDTGDVIFTHGFIDGV